MFSTVFELIDGQQTTEKYGTSLAVRIDAYFPKTAERYVIVMQTLYPSFLERAMLSHLKESEALKFKAPNKPLKPLGLRRRNALEPARFSKMTELIQLNFKNCTFA